MRARYESFGYIEAKSVVAPVREHVRSIQLALRVGGVR